MLTYITEQTPVLVGLKKFAQVRTEYNPRSKPQILVLMVSESISTASYKNEIQAFGKRCIILIFQLHTLTKHTVLARRKRNWREGNNDTKFCIWSGYILVIYFPH